MPAAAAAAGNDGMNDVSERGAHDDQVADAPEADGVTAAASPDAHSAAAQPAGPAGHAVLMADGSQHDAVASGMDPSCQNKAGWMHPVRAVPLCGSSADQSQVCVTKYVCCCLSVGMH